MDTKRTLAFLLIVIAAAAFLSPAIVPSAVKESDRGATLEQGRYLVESVTIEPSKMASGKMEEC
jgi:hypothetical protein